MKRDAVYYTIKSLYLWLEGDGTLSEVMTHLGDDSHLLQTMLMENGLIGSNDRPSPDLPANVIIDCVLLFVGMRHSLQE